MQLRSLSIAVPTNGHGKNGKGCPNNCAFCVSALDETVYPNLVEKEDLLYEREYLNRLNFCIERNFEAMVITGTGEPLLNIPFLQKLAHWNKETIRPFRWIDLQTSGVLLNDSKKLSFLRNSLGVTGISLSLSSIFSSTVNQEINGIQDCLAFKIFDLCQKIKASGFNLRLSLNMWRHYDNIDFSKIFSRAKELGANQITFRMLYTSGNPTLLQNKWIEQNRFGSKQQLDSYIKKNGTALEPVSFGAMRYDVEGISTILDNDCMSTKTQDEVRYLVLRPNCRLYTKWSTSGSLLF
jgi:organic radical activating enzyme